MCYRFISVLLATSWLSYLVAGIALSTRPHCVPHSSPPRNRICYVESHNDLITDDSDHILAALQDCNHGGHVVFEASRSYLIGTALDLTFLRHVDIDIQGDILFTNDTDYWQANAFKQVFQNATTFFQLGGEDVNVYGGGTLNGNGQVWYDLYAKDIYILRPILFGTIGLHNGSISNLNLRYSPQWYNLVANSSNVIFSDITISGYSSSDNIAKNTDGWDTYRSDSIVIQNSTINNGDGKLFFRCDCRLLTQLLRLRILQTKLYQHPCTESSLQRKSWNFSGLAWSIR